MPFFGSGRGSQTEDRAEKDGRGLTPGNCDAFVISLTCMAGSKVIGNGFLEEMAHFSVGQSSTLPGWYLLRQYLTVRYGETLHLLRAILLQTMMVNVIFWW